MADISKINLGGTTYSIKDASARTSISQIQSAIVNTLKFKGITTIALTNDGTQVPTDLYGAKATVADIRIGDLVVYGKAEYVWIEKKSGETSTKCWCLLDALNAYGKLASKDSASGTTSAAGAHKHTVSVPTYTGATSTFTGSCVPNGAVTLTAAADGVKITGSVSAPAVTLIGGETSKLVTATAKGVTGTGAAVTSVTQGAPTLAPTTGTFVTGGTVSAPTAGINIKPATSNAVTSVAAPTKEVTGKASYDATTECLTLPITSAVGSVSAPTSAFMTGATCADKFVTGVTHTLTTANALTGVTVKAPGTATVKTATFSQGAVEFTYATGKIDASGTGSAVVTDLPTGATATAPTFTATTGLKATFTGTATQLSASGIPVIKKSTAESIATSEVAAHTHTVTVQ